MRTIEATINNIKSIGDSARVAFIDREELIGAFEIAMVSGLHLIVLGAPGTGKSKLARYFSNATTLPFFKTLLNPDLPREELIGPIDPIALQRGEWSRQWLGVATAPIAFIDEIGKGSAQVMNLLLNAMEERTAMCADTEIDIPLHTLIAASNETIATESPALWNRFSLRVIVERIGRTSDFERFLSDAWSTDSPPSIPIENEELIVLREKCREMASEAHKSTAIKRTIVKMFVDAPNVCSVVPTPRQWLNVLTAAAAVALLNGRERIVVSDLKVAGMILWDNVSEIDEVKAFVDGLVQQEDRELKATSEVIGQMSGSYDRMSENDLEGLGRLSFRAKKLRDQIQEKWDETGSTDWEDMFNLTDDLITEIERKGREGVDPMF